MMRYILLLLVIITSSHELFSNSTPYQLTGVGMTNKINASITQDVYLTDEYDTPINLKDLITSKPTIINFVYLNCPLLCHLLLDGITDVVSRSPYQVSKDYQIISISIDPKETNQNLKSYKKKYLSQLNISNGWFFLKGSKEQIETITKAFGYRYKYIKRTKDYSHPSAIYFYHNKITNYLEGVTFDLNAFNYSIINTKSIKTLKEKIITYCYYYDPDSQTYSLLIFKILRLLCLITVLILSILIIYLIQKERNAINHESH